MQLPILRPVLFAALITLFAFPVVANENNNPRRSANSVPRTTILEISDQIDSIVAAQLSSRNEKLNALSSDEIFLRRAYLDIIGRIPSMDETTRFLRSKSKDKRADLIDDLLDSYGHVSHQFNFYADLLRIKSRLPGNLVRGARDAEIAAAARRRARARYGAWYLTPDLWEAEFRCRRDGNDPEVVLPQQMSQLKASRRRRRAANATPPPGADARAQTPAATPGPQAKGGDAAGATNTSAEATESRPTQHIATLYSGRMYREYLRRRGSRLPHYLNLPDDVNNRRQGRRYRRSQEPFVSSMASVAHPPGDTAGSAGLSVEG